MSSESPIKVGFIGLGNMGFAMARCLPASGLDVTVYDLDKAPIDKMVKLGAKAVGSSRAVAAASSAIITMVRDIKQTDEVIFGKNGVWEGIQRGSIIIVSSSVGPRYCQELYVRARKEKGVKVVDCAVSDPSDGAHYLQGQLTLMVGGDDEDVKRCWPIFDAMGKNIFHLGETGKGQAYKLINNAVAMHVMGVANECINLGLKAGLDRDKMIEVMSVSTGGIWSFSNQVFMKKAGIAAPVFSRPPGTGVAPAQERMAFEIQKAYEIADELGVPMPVCRFIQEHGKRWRDG